jgi:parallel beta-helix repeat protein
MTKGKLMKTGMILPMALNVCYVRLFSRGIWITRRARFILAALVSLLMAGTLRADTHYVDATRPDDSGDGLSWATAEKTIQAAITASAAGDTITVTNGVYAPIATTNNSITIQSVNGATFTIIDGSGTSRCATFGSSSSHTNTALVGFTLRNGYASYGGGSYHGTLINCTLAGNRATSYGGGSSYGMLNNCTLTGNSADNGGGSYWGTLNNCTLTGNSATDGGGAYWGTLNNCTLAGNSASYGGGSYSCTLNNCTLTGNSATNGGGANNGTLNSCTLTGNSASSDGGGTWACTLNNCTLTGNSASSDGGGSYSGTINNCKFSGNSAASYGGGSMSSTLNNCTLSGNSASSGGGGSYRGTLNNCMLVGNSASSGGGSYFGTLNNCTLAGNNAASSGGGSYNGALTNCIVWGNTLVSGVTNNYSGGTFSCSCTSPLPSGTGNLSSDPLFRLPVAFDFRLSPASPCLNAGMNDYTVGSMDVLGNARIQDGTVDMGACEDAWTLETDESYFAQTISATGCAEGVAVSWDPPAVDGALFYRVCRMDLATGQWAPVSDWITESSFLDTQLRGGATCRYVIVSAFDDHLNFISGLSAPAEGQRILIPLYVDGARPDDAGDGRSWATAKKTIQTAIDISAPYDTILVTNGVYAPISTGNKTVTIQSVNGAAVTIIDGGGTNRCATLGGFPIHVNTILVAFTLRNGNFSNGGGSYYGTLNNCTLSGNRASNGGGSYWGKLSNCTLTGNSASSSGGGLYYGMLNDCTLAGNSASSGGGSYFGTLNNCTLTGNSASSSGGGSYFGTLNNCTLSGNNAASSGGGSYYCMLNNCTLSGNSASYGGGSYWGTLNNCTLAGNSASFGGGSCNGALTNCIVWGNTLLSGVTNNFYGGTFSYSCTSPLPPGTGNLSSDPLFRLPGAWDFRLSPASPCLNAGMNDYTVGSMDVLGNARIQDGTVDMGACEDAWTLETDESYFAQNISATGCAEGVAVSWDPPAVDGPLFYHVCRMDLATGQWAPVSDWITESSFLDTQLRGGATCRYVIVSAFDDHLNVISGLSAPAEGQRILIPLHVDGARPDDAGDGRSWSTAKKTIQAAIDLSAPYDTILVTNGVYAPISTGNKAITIQSVNGAAVTIIDGGGTNRCATLGSFPIHVNTILVAFTLRNGNFSNGGGSYYGTLNNCTLSGNCASSGGGSYWGTLNNCTLTGNSASSSGGGSYDGTLNNCTLTGNSASSFPSSSGGGSYNGTMNNCTLEGNSASYDGGGSYAGTLNNCTLTGNSASYGGGAHDAMLSNCTLTGNRASGEGGGSYSGALTNCTLWGNSASSNGGGSRQGTLNNCIVWGNTLASGVANNYFGGTFRYSCTVPLPLGTGNISADPVFRLLAAGDFRLLPGSPCLNTGMNSYVIGVVDLLGNARIQEGRVDMGSCEGSGTLVTDAPYLAHNVLATGEADGVAVSWQPPSIGGAVLYRVCRMDSATGQWMPVSGWITELSFLDLQVLGGVIYRYAIVAAFDARLDVISGLSEPAEGQRILIPQVYVDASRPNDAGDGRSWTTAKKTIQAGIALSVPYDTILVTNGVYAPISTTNKTIAIRSVNGAAVTIIDGGATSRCATLGSLPIHLNTLLVGFTLRNGSASSGGGSCYGTLDNCTLSANSASYGGGSYCGLLNNCTLTLNFASSYGGGSYSGLLNRCTLTLNRSNNGGGAYYGTLNNCTLSDNSVTSSGGGVYNATLNNCTLSGNSAASFGGGSSYGTLNNCIVWGNSLVSGVTNNYSGGTFQYSNTTPLRSGIGNVSVDPLFNDTENSNYLLRVGSPCINTGSDAFVVGTTDLLGNPRIVAGRVDMGAYEMPTTVTVTFDANGGLLATGQAVTNLVGFAGDLYDSWLSLSNGISRVGYTFAGWFTASSGGALIFSNNTITAGSIYAQWMANSYAVTLDWQNGLDVTLTNVLYGQAYQLPPAVFGDAAFLGWWTLPNGIGSAILPETLVSVASNHTLYAKWDVNSVVGSTGLVWQTAGDSLWFVQTNAVTQGLSAMQSGVISDNQTSWIGTSVTGPGRFSFWWRVSSEGGYDELAFAVDGVRNRAISGTKKDEWQVVEVAFTNAGAHELRWTYSKDDSASAGLDCGWLDRVAWIPSRPVIPGNPNVSSNFLDTVTQMQIDALIAGLRAAHPDVTDTEIARKFEDADLFGFTGAALVNVGADALVRLNPSITLSTLSVSEGDPKTLVVAVTIANNIDPTPALALARIGEAINSRMRGVFKNSLSAGASEMILTPALSLDNATGVVTATFTLEPPFASTGFLRMSLRK